MVLPTRVSATTDDDAGLRQLAERALRCHGHVDDALELARHIGQTAPYPGGGSTLTLWDLFSTLASTDVTVARVIEPHLDALAILHEAPHADLDQVGANSESTWGVFAAEAPGGQLTATLDDGRWVLDGAKAWCSLAGSLTHALVTAHTGPTTRRLFAVSLRAPGVSVREGQWHATGLAAVPSGPVDFHSVHAVPVGADNWYLTRPGFAWGGIGVAACWWGGAVGVARRAFEAAEGREPDQLALMHLGALDAALHSARVALTAAAAVVDDGEIDRNAAGILALRTRTVVARAAEDVIARVGHALGPAPLALEADHARRVADLQLYLRQHHAQRDDVALGRKLLARGVPAW